MKKIVIANEVNEVNIEELREGILGTIIAFKSDEPNGIYVLKQYKCELSRSWVDDDYHWIKLNNALTIGEIGKLFPSIISQIKMGFDVYIFEGSNRLKEFLEWALVKVKRNDK